MPDVPGFEGVFSLAENFIVPPERPEVVVDEEDLLNLDFQGLAGEVVDGYADMFVSEAKRYGKKFAYPVFFVNPEKGMGFEYKYFFLSEDGEKSRPSKNEVQNKQGIKGKYVFEYLKTGSNGLKAIFKNMEKKYDGKSLQKVVRENFEKAFNGTSLKKFMDEGGISGLFVDLSVIGQVICESKYDLNSEDGIWQITEIAMKGGVGGDRKSPKDSTEMAVDLHERNFQALKNDVVSFCEKYEIDPHCFMVPAVIGAYQSGMGRIEGVLSWADLHMENKLVKFLEEQKNLSKFSRAVAAYVFISGNYYVDAKNGNNGASGRYGEVSVNYVPKVFGVTRALKGRTGRLF